MMAADSLPSNEGAVSEVVICGAEAQSRLKLKTQNSGFSFER